MAQKKALFLSDTTDWCHWGSCGTSLGLRAMIASAYYYQGSISLKQITALDLDPNGKDARTLDQLESTPALFKQIKAADVLVCNGEGSLHGAGLLPLKMLRLLEFCAEYLGKEVIACNQSVYPDDYSLVEGGELFERYKAAFQTFDYVAVREHQTLKQMELLGIDAKLSFDTLSLFLRDGLKYAPLAPRKNKSKDKNKAKTVLVSSSSSWTPDMIAPLVAMIKQLQFQGYQPVFIDGAKANATAKERQIFEILAPKIKGLRYNFAPSLRAWIQTFDQADLVVSGRYHHFIAAHYVNTPVVLIDGITSRLPGTCQLFDYPMPIAHKAETMERDLLDRFEAFEAGAFDERRFHDPDHRSSVYDYALNNLPISLDPEKLSLQMRHFAPMAKRTWLDRLSDQRHVLRFDVKDPHGSLKAWSNKARSMITK